MTNLLTMNMTSKIDRFDINPSIRISKRIGIDRPFCGIFLLTRLIIMENFVRAMLEHWRNRREWWITEDAD